MKHRPYPAAARIRVLILVLLLAPVLLAGEVDLRTLPSGVTVSVDADQQLEAGLHAITPLTNPGVNGRRLASALPHEATVLVPASGDGLFNYHDLFLRHWHDRTQTLVDLEGTLLENLNGLPVGAVLPKILEDAWTIEAPDLYLDGAEDRLWWSGTLTWRFDVGSPITSLSLADPTGTRHTTVVDEGWQERGQGVVVSVSADGATWHEVWRSTGAGGESPVEATLPGALSGATVLYLRFTGLENALLDLHVTLGFDASEIRGGLQLGAGTRELTVAADGGGSAILFWSNPGVVTAGSPRPLPPPRR